MMRVVCLILATAFAMRAEPVLLTHNAQGALLGQSPAVFRSGGYAFVPREALYRAASATLQDEQGRLHPVLWITGEDADASVAEVWVGAQAPQGPDSTSGITPRVRSRDHDAALVPAKESGAFGYLSRLHCEHTSESASGPLYDDHGLFAGWHASRAVDGRVLSFAIPLERIESMSRTLHLTLAEWNRRHNPEREAPYLRALGHLWADDFDGALFYFRQAAELDPSNARAWLHLGFAEGKNGRGRARVEAYRKAIELDPSLAEAHYLLGVSLLLAGDRDGAEDELKALKKLDKRFAERLEQFLDALHVDRLDPRPRKPAPKRLA